MTEQLNREVAVLNAALEMPAKKRAAYLDQACAGDTAMRRRVEELLRAHEQAEGFLEAPAEIPNFKRTEVVNIPLTEKPGDKIGRYKLLQQIGEGGCGVVYMAEQEEPVRRRVALKVIKLGMDTKQVIARFEAERQALALMDHPNIARVLDAGATETGRPYFVMELVRGIKITEFCDQNKIPTEERLRLFIQVCQAIQHAHQKGVIHRDIKPSNILVTINEPGSPGVPKVIDFGIAKATAGRLTDQTLFTAFEQFIGTPAYMSPEQAVMTALDIDTRSDVYSLGVLLYELLTGKTPFDQKELLASGLDEMRRTIREKEPLKPSTRLTQELVAAPRQSAADSRDENGGALPRRRYGQIQELIHLLRGDLDWIAMKCLEKDRARRYETANALAADIRRHLDCEPVIARPPSRLYRLQKAVRRNKSAFAAAAALAAVLVIGVVMSTSQAIRATRAEREQTRQRQKAETKEQKSEQVAQLLKDMLKSVGPSVALGRDTTMLQEILDATVERMGKTLTNQPEVEVELCLTLAATYHDLGLYKQMEEVALQSLQVARSSLGKENESVAASLTALGDALQHLGETQPASLEEAEKYCRDGLTMSRKLLGGEHPKVAEALTHLANVLAVQGRLVEAEKLKLETLAMYERLFGHECPEVAKALFDLALILRQGNRLAEAEKINREALAMQRKLLGDVHPEVAKSLRSLGAVLWYQGKLGEAEAKYLEALATWRKLQTNDRAELFWTHRELAIVLEEQGKLGEAETFYREALAIQRRLFGNEHSKVVDSLYELAHVLQQQGKLAEAERLCREALQNLRAGVPANNPRLDGPLVVFTQFLLDEEKFAEAEPVARESLENRQKNMPDKWPTFHTRSVLGGILSKQKKYAEAEPLLLSGYEGLKEREEKLTKTGRVCYKESVGRLAEFYEATGQQDKATQWKQKLAEFDKAEK